MVNRRRKKTRVKMEITWDSDEKKITFKTPFFHPSADGISQLFWPAKRTCPSLSQVVKSKDVIVIASNWNCLIILPFWNLCIRFIDNRVLFLEQFDNCSFLLQVSKNSKRLKDFSFLTWNEMIGFFKFLKCVLLKVP